MKEKIIQSIQKGEVTMHPRFYFIARLFGVGFLTFLVFTISIFLANIVFFTIRVSTNLSFLGFEGKGVLMFLATFPWFIFLIDILLIYILGRLLNTFRFAYKKPALYIGLFAVVFIALSGFLVDKHTRINEHMVRTPQAQPLYMRRPAPHSVCDDCTVTRLEGGRILLEKEGKQFIILPPTDGFMRTTGTQGALYIKRFRP